MQVKTTLQSNNVSLKYMLYKFEENRIMLYNNNVYVLERHEIKRIVLYEMHNVPYAGHPSYQKTITTVNKDYYWP